ncbi:MULTISPECIES: O-antigen ligase family protein [Flavobacteriaceae]|uniref:O-antigen ligase family protein n=1 Tax=Flavobacteriaceae TaxID=49546 RepID=UPI001490ECD7|nr:MULTISPECIES: O-antigen ligase family protein [Allomuricauda]MDC6366488.1 O-antigen ligase family protein [Muricauda sp. AC10]
MVKKIQKYRDNISNLVVIAIAITLPLEIKYGNIILIVGFGLSLFFLRKKDLSGHSLYLLAYPFVFFLVALLSGLFSKDTAVGFSRLDRHLLPLLLTVSLVVFQGVSLIKVLKYFTIVMTFTTTALNIKVIYGLAKGLELKDLVFHQYASIFDQHPVYYALLILIAVLFLLSGIHGFDIRKKASNILLLQLIVLITGMVLCASKAVLGIFVVLVFVGIVLRIKGKKNKLIAFLSVVILSFCTYHLKYIKVRFLEGTQIRKEILSFRPTNDFTLKKKFSYAEKKNIQDLELRILFLKIALYHMYKDQTYLFGYGVGDSQNYLDYYLYSYNLGPNWYQGFNVHNQYLHILFNYGVLVLLLFLYYLFLSFKQGLKNRDYLYMAILIAFCFTFLFEVSLIRNKGIVLFYFFNLLFLINRNNLENSYTRN